MNDLNTVALIGRLTRDPELRTTGGGTSVVTLRLAFNSSVKRGDEWGEEVGYVDVTAWAGQADTCARYLSKGRAVAVQGRLHWREWEAQDGTKRQRLEVTANNVQFLSDGKTDRPSDGPTDTDYAPVAAAAGDAPDADDIPF